MTNNIKNYSLDIIIKAAQFGTFICPVSVNDPDNWGLFNQTFKKKDQQIFYVGLLNVEHRDVCELLGVQMEEGPDGIPPSKTLVSRRHIHSFVQSLKQNFDQNDFGSIKNEGWKWCDLQANKCPSIFMNSIDANDVKRTPNVIFEVDIDENDQPRIILTALRDIHPGEELLGNYLG